MPTGSPTCSSISWKSWMSQKYKCISSKAAEIWECSVSSLEILSPADVLLSWLEPRERSQLPSNWPPVQTRFSLCAYKIYACMLWQTWTAFWLAFVELAKDSHHFLLVLFIPWQSFRQMHYFYLTYMHMVHFHACVLRNIFPLYHVLLWKASAHSFS